MRTRRGQPALSVLFILLSALPVGAQLRPQVTGKPKKPPPKPKHVEINPGTVKVNPKDGLRYVWIPPGTFQMGCSPGDSESFDWEKPSHQVTISRGFWMGQTEVTVGAYKRFAGGTGKAMPPEPDILGRALNSGWNNEAMPIVDVTWDDARHYCTWAGGRLPTEAEWEYAARGGSTEARYGSLDEVAWYADDSGQQRLDSERIWKDDQKNYSQRLKDNRNGMHEVAKKRANGFGLYDVLGNVWEWVNDWYDGHYYANSPSTDPSGPTSGQIRILRGGSWGNGPGDGRVSNRGAGSIRAAGTSTVGFVARGRWRRDLVGEGSALPSEHGSARPRTVWCRAKRSPTRPFRAVLVREGSALPRERAPGPRQNLGSPEGSPTSASETNPNGQRNGGRPKASPTKA